MLNEVKTNRTASTCPICLHVIFFRKGQFGSPSPFFGDFVGDKVETFLPFCSVSAGNKKFDISPVVFKAAHPFPYLLNYISLSSSSKFDTIIFNQVNT